MNGDRSREEAQGKRLYPDTPNKTRSSNFASLQQSAIYSCITEPNTKFFTTSAITIHKLSSSFKIQDFLRHSQSLTLRMIFTNIV